MSDYNDFLLPDPCLRMDTHFGDEYESVEFGDGTGYVKAVPTLARLGALHVELDGLRDENAKLRELCATVIDDWMSKVCPSFPFCEFGGEYQDCTDETCGNQIYRQMARELGVEVNE